PTPPPLPSEIPTPQPLPNDIPTPQPLPSDIPTPPPLPSEIPTPPPLPTDIPHNVPTGNSGNILPVQGSSSTTGSHPGAHNTPLSNEANSLEEVLKKGILSKIATCLTKPCTLTDTTEYINLRDKFLSKIKEISEKEIGKVVV
ncbi:hypothetical protein CWI39_2793p0010, partial [Hamiltosporidium magnivora]